VTAADRVIRWSTALAVLGVAVVAAVASYEHAYDLVRAHGEVGWTARLVPLTVATGTYDAELGIDTGALWEFIGKTQPEPWRELLELYGEDQDTGMRQFAFDGSRQAVMVFNSYTMSVSPPAGTGTAAFQRVEKQALESGGNLAGPRHLVRHRRHQHGHLPGRSLPPRPPLCGLRAGAAGYRSAPRSASRRRFVSSRRSPARFSGAVLRRRGVAPIRRSITTAVPCQIRRTAAR
jgi:hypothetical protein